MSSPSNAGTSSIVTPLAGAATWQPNADASNSVIARVPLQPRRTWSQKRSRPTPNGETTPMPLMTTRGWPEWRMAGPTILRFKVQGSGFRVQSGSENTRMVEGLVRWAGGAVFVVALLVCAGSFVFSLEHARAI